MSNELIQKVCEQCRLGFRDYVDSLNGLCIYCREKMSAGEWQLYIDGKAVAYFHNKLAGRGRD